MRLPHYSLPPKHPHPLDLYLLINEGWMINQDKRHCYIQARASTMGHQCHVVCVLLMCVSVFGKRITK